MRQVATYIIICVAALTNIVSSRPTHESAKTLQRRAIGDCPTTESYNPHNYFQGVEFLSITGPGATNVHGTYARHGAFMRNGLPVFINADLGHYLYYANADEMIWFVSTDADFFSRDLNAPIQNWFNTVVPWCTTDPSGELAVITPFSSEPNQSACSSSPCGSNTFCVDTEAAYDCRCLSGFVADDIYTGSCTLDTCSTLGQPCGGHSVCLNSASSYHCHCDDGFTYRSNTCLDVDECSQANICGSVGECTNTFGSYVCTCPTGYQSADSGDLTSECVDLDECSQGNTCGSVGDCTNTLGSYGCTCPIGFQNADSDDLTSECVDFDECLQGYICGSVGDCTNTLGSYVCTCPFGFQHADPGDYTSECVDTDECLSDPCGYDAYCVNAIGSYDCQCQRGYEMTDKGCMDVNECVADPNVCGINAKCQNADGGYICQCESGYDYNVKTGGERQCEDINECQSTDACSEHATCTNTIGSYQCTIDMHECGPGTTCPSNSDCYNTPGSYECRCRSGYELNVYGNLQGEIITECVDVDECMSNPCSDTAQCVNIPGSYSCEIKLIARG